MSSGHTGYVRSTLALIEHQGVGRDLQGHGELAQGIQGQLGRRHLGMVGAIISEWVGGIVGIRTEQDAWVAIQSKINRRRGIRPELTAKIVARMGN